MSLGIFLSIQPKEVRHCSWMGSAASYFAFFFLPEVLERFGSRSVQDHQVAALNKHTCGRNDKVIIILIIIIRRDFEL